MPNVISLHDARQILLSRLAAVETEAVPLIDAPGRILASDIIAAEDLVPFARSAMDGFAVRATDTDTASREKPVELQISGAAFAEAGSSSIARRTAIAISTGAPVPIGADAVIPIEEVEVANGRVRIFAPCAGGQSIFPPAEDAKRGEVLLHRGERIQGRDIGMLAMAGISSVPAFRRPRVSILTTGNELVEISAAPKFGQIRNSNSPALAALVEECGAESRIVGVAPDDPASVREFLQRAAVDADLVITAGGASRGERDYIKQVLAELGTEMKFNTVAMRPGRPMGFAVWDKLPVCIVPGNPAAVFVCFQVFVAPAIRKLAGLREEKILAPKLRARIRGRIHGRPGLEYVVFARASMTSGRLEVQALRNQCSALVRSASEANALVFLPMDGLQSEFAEIEILDWESVVRSGESAASASN
jgi:molybdopterin molybdotransferase